MIYEYKVIPAPEKGEKARGRKTPEARFAGTLERVMNELGADGWEYLRADTLPSAERSGLTNSTTVWRHLLVFRRAAPSMDAAQDMDPPASTAAPVVQEAPPQPQASMTLDRPVGYAPRENPTMTAPPRAPATPPEPTREDPDIAEPVRKLFADPAERPNRAPPPLSRNDEG